MVSSASSICLSVAEMPSSSASPLIQIVSSSSPPAAASSSSYFLLPGAGVSFNWPWAACCSTAFSSSASLTVPSGTLVTVATSPEGTLGWPIPSAIAKPAKRTTKRAPKRISPKRWTRAALMRLTPAAFLLCPDFAPTRRAA